MKRYVLVLMAVLVLGLPGGVRASEVSVPNPESRWFGLSWAIEKVRHNFEMWTARTEEKKAELELKFAEKEERLAERIAKLEEVNPRAAERLGKVAENLKEKRIERMERVEMRIQRIEEKGEGRVEQIKERVEERRMMDDDDGEVMEGKGVRIKNAKPGVMRVR